MADIGSNIIPTVEEVIQSRRDQSSYSEFRFPDDLGAHAIILNFSDYSYDRSANTVSTVTNTSICLPIPSELKDSIGVRIAANELGVMGDLARTIAGASMGSNSITEALNKIQSDTDLGASTAAKAIKAALASTDNSVVRGFETAWGTIVNPHVALTFDGVNLKTHTFTWTLAPTSSSESVRLAKMIKTIKRDILPKYKKDAGRTFLQYPKVCDVFFLGSEPGHLYFFKRCMVSDFATDYAPMGTPAFLPNGRPAVVNITMTLNEMEIHTSDDYSGE